MRAWTACGSSTDWIYRADQRGDSMKKRNPNRPIVLALHDAAAIHRMLEFWYLQRAWFNPIEAVEATTAGREAMDRLGDKLAAIFTAHEDAQSVGAVDPSAGHWESRPRA